MASTTVYDGNEARRLSADVAEEDGEAAPLLSHGSEPNLYRTLSRRSETLEPLPRDEGDDDDAEEGTSSGVYATLSVLLVGVFISQTDQSLVIATYGRVASEFNELDNGSWLLSAFVLAQCVAQPLYGKLSDIFGRKSCLQASYILFALGTAGSGLGRTMGQIIAARAIQGAGGAGMLSMVSIIITDLVPVQEVASLRSYVNVLQTTGRSCGGVVGGFLTETLGWRWAFLVQVPPMILAIALVQWRLDLKPKEEQTKTSTWKKLRRIDFMGALFLSGTIFSLCFALDSGGQKIPWDSPTMIGILVLGAVSTIAFVLSARWAAEPIFPLRIMAHYDVFTNYILIFLQLIAQMSLMMAVPLYVIATERVSTATAGAYLVPAFVGNTIGGLSSGYWIKKTGRYKTPTVLAPCLSIICMTLCLLTWTGDISVLKSLFVLPGGAAAGMISSSAFVGLAAGVAEEDIAIAGSGMYLFFNLGAVSGISLGSAVFQSTLRTGLQNALPTSPDKADIIRRALTDMKFVKNAKDSLRSVLISTYVQAFHGVNILGLVASGISLVIAVFTRSRRLQAKE